MTSKTAQQIIDHIHEVFIEDIEADVKIFKRIETYEEAGLLTTDVGLVLYTDTGEKFNLTISRGSQN